MSSVNANMGKFINKDPDVFSFMLQEHEKIQWVKQAAALELNSALSRLTPTDLTDDAKVISIWRDFQTQGLNQLYLKFFPPCDDSEKYKDALTGPLLKIFQDSVRHAREK